MSPRAGGEADKIGNRYEGAWTIWHLLQCLIGRGASIIVEAVGDLADGAELHIGEPRTVLSRFIS